MENISWLKNNCFNKTIQATKKYRNAIWRQNGSLRQNKVKKGCGNPKKREINPYIWWWNKKQMFEEF